MESIYRSERLLNILLNLEKSLPKSKSLKIVSDKDKYDVNVNTKSAINFDDQNELESYGIPLNIKDRSAFIDWAYYEATTLVRQYGNLLESVRAYMKTGTASVGECVLMIEQELS